ncbi:hypothetical protein GCM10018966_039750 [Streptomyces yanii]
MFALFFLRFAEDTLLGTAALLLGLFVGRLSVRGEKRCGGAVHWSVRRSPGRRPGPRVHGAAGDVEDLLSVVGQRRDPQRGPPVLRSIAQVANLPSLNSSIQTPSWSSPVSSLATRRDTLRLPSVSITTQ